MYSILPDRKQWQFGGIVCGVCESTMLIGKASEKSGPIRPSLNIWSYQSNLGTEGHFNTQVGLEKHL